MRYEELVQKIGRGFHPDTRGADYVSLSDGVTPELVDEVVDGAFKFQKDTGENLTPRTAEWCDPYARAQKALDKLPPD